MKAKCKMGGETTSWPCAARGCPLYGDCLCEYETSTKRPLTHADRIRVKIGDDLELAKLAVRYEGRLRETVNDSGGGKHTFYGPDGETMPSYAAAIQAWMDWLTQPAQEEE